jgi:hypothetical protein
MTSLKDQQKLLKDAGKGVVDGIKKIAEPFVKEAVGLPEAKKLLQGLKAGAKKKYAPEFKNDAVLIPTKKNNKGK